MKYFALALTLLLTLSTTTKADPVVHGGGSANVAFFGVFNWELLPLENFAVTNTSALTLSEVGFALPTYLQGSQFWMAYGAGVFNAAPDDPLTFSVVINLAAYQTAVFGIRGRWLDQQGHGLPWPTIYDATNLYFVQSVPEPASVFLLLSGLTGIVLRRKKRYSLFQP